MPKLPVNNPTAVAVKAAAASLPVVPVIDAGLPSGGAKMPWLRFWNERAKNAADVKAAIPGITSGRAYLARPTDKGTEFCEITVFQIAAATLFFTETKLAAGGNMKLIRAQLEEPARTDKDLSRDIVALVVAHTATGVYPCIASFRKAAAPAAQLLLNAAQEAGDWRAVVAPLKYTLRTAKGSGFNYTLVESVPTPINAKQAKALAKLSAKAMDEAFEGYELKCAEIMQVVNGGEVEDDD